MNIVINSEQYRDLSEPSWVTDGISTADIWVYGELGGIDVPLPRFTWVEVSRIRLYSFDLLPSNSIEEFERSLDAIVYRQR